MHIVISDDAVDQRIHRFRASKSPWRTIGLTIADRLTAPKGARTKEVGISYEQTRWHPTAHL